MTKSETARIVADLNAIAQYAERARSLLATAEVGSDADKIGMQQTWILQAVKSALHTINRV